MEAEGEAVEPQRMLEDGAANRGARAAMPATGQHQSMPSIASWVLLHDKQLHGSK